MSVIQLTWGKGSSVSSRRRGAKPMAANFRYSTSMRWHWQRLLLPGLYDLDRTRTARTRSFRLCRAVELRIAPKDAVLVEGDPAVRCQVGGDTGQGRNPVVQRNHPRVFRLEPRHRAREGIARTCHYLKKRQIRVSQLRTDEVRRAGWIALQYPVEISEVLGRSRFQKIGGAGPRLPPLVFVIEAAGYRMMGIVRLVYKIGDRQLQLMGP